MKNALYCLILILLTCAEAFAQTNAIYVNKQNAQEKKPASYPIDALPFLRSTYEAVAKYNLEHPDAEAQMKLSKTTAWNFQVGSTKAWYAQNLTTNKFYQVPSTCRKVGTNCYVFVEDVVWNTNVTQAAVDSVAKYFDSKTPANASKGIYQSDVDAFGNPPDVDSDPKIIILILDVKDGYEGEGGFVAGFFDPTHENSMTNSNKAEIYFLDCDPQDLTTSSGIMSAVSTTAHEFQHMIHYNYHKTRSQLTFINEGCSMLAEVNAGFSIEGQTGQYGYNSETNHYLLDWRSNDPSNVLKDYSRASRFFTYIRDQYGIGVFKPLVASQTISENAITEAIATTGRTITFQDLYANFAMANIVDDNTLNTAYAYVYQGIPKPTGTVFGNPNASQSSSVSRYGVDYLTFNAGSNLGIKITVTEPELRIKALLAGPGGKKIVDVPANTQFNEPLFGTTYTTATFALINPTSYTTSGGFSIPYSFTSTGTTPSSMEMKWDLNEPTGYYIWATNDTIAVTFNSMAGGKLDSIRVALRRAGSITGGIYTATGVQNPSPLGKPLASPITASITTETPLPYLVPFKNWTTVDLRSYNIKTDQPFAAAFVIGTVPNAPGIMATKDKYPAENTSHSFSYISAGDNLGSTGWYYITTNSTRDSAVVYLIRAYVSFGTTDVKGAGIQTAPSSYSLSQNYPNPFNPSTTISYAIPKQAFVELKIYDMLGREVSTLVNKEQNAGEYRVQFDASSLPAGIYVYSIRSGDYSASRKLVLLK